MRSATDSDDKQDPIHVLVIEDDLEVLEVVTLILETRWPGVTVSHSNDGELGVQLARTEEPDVIILDIGLPGIDGFEVCSRIRAFSYTPILILTVRESPEDIAKGLDLGADDYIVKPFRPAVLLARVNAVLLRSDKAHLTDVEMIFRHRDLIITFRQGEVHANGELIRLPPTEYEIFYHLVTNAGRVVTSQTMIDDIWGEEYRAEPYFLTSRVSRLQETLQRHSQTEDLILQEESGGYSLTMTKGNIF